MKPIFSICHTSARPDEWEKIYRAWLDMAHDPDCVEYVLVVDHDWGFEKLPTLRIQDKAIWARGARHCYVDGVNLAAKNATGKVLIVNADDQFPCQDWDLRLLETIPDIEADFIVLPSTGTPDEHIRRIAVMPILSHARYKKYGYALYPEYESMFSDSEFLAHARFDKCVIEAKHLMFPHKHPLCDPDVQAWEKRDAQYRAQNREAAFELGNAIFQQRIEANFEGPKRILERRTIIVCLPGEQFSSKWVAHWTDVFARLSANYFVGPLFCESSNVHVTRAVLAKDALEISHADFILWIDDDNLVTGEQVERLIKHMDDYPDTIDMVAAWCEIGHKGQEPLLASCGLFNERGLNVPLKPERMETGPILRRVQWTGFPVVLMRREALAKLDKPFAPLLNPESPYGFDSEDIAFCKRANELDLGIYVDTRMKVPHLKLRDANVSPATAGNLKGEKAWQ